ncbi:uncharacterized protein LOC118467781 [Anopheles albimanus]|uniref:Uncharacterized protein n=1 Tax=Anopheles albimanus TaxID=7167 RepID=A0A182FLF9_ANOAL|nr:uncharacterized protein LOC118467781 [Anopheles albimanus]
MERTIHTSYNHDFQPRPNNRQLVVQRKSELHRPDGCFMLPASTAAASVSDIPDGGTPEQQKQKFEEEARRKNWQRCGANRFVKGLARTHPELYWELTAKDRAWQERAGGSPLKSSYQLDYDRLPEGVPCPVSPVPALPSRDDDDDPAETSRWPDWKYFQRECNGVPACRAMNGSTDGKIGLCSCQLCPSPSSDQWRRAVCSEPFHRYGRVEAISNIPKSFITSGHWPEPDWQTAVRHSTEYREKVGRMGAVVQRANIHNHARCTSQRNCRHRFFV